MDVARLLLLASLFLILPTPADSSLIGDEIVLTHDFTSGSNPGSGVPVVVGAGSEYVIIGAGDNRIDVDVQASSISVFKSSGLFEGAGPFTLAFTSLNWFDAPSGSILDVVLVLNGLIGLSQADVSFSGDSITVTSGDTTGWGGSENGNGFDLLISPTHDPIPEPATALLLSLGLVGLASRRHAIT